MAKPWVTRNLRESRAFRNRIISDAEAVAAKWGDEHIVLAVSDVHPLDSFLDTVRDVATDAGMSPTEISDAIARRKRATQETCSLVGIVKRNLEIAESLRDSIAVTLQALGKAKNDHETGDFEGALCGVATAASLFARCIALYSIEPRRLGGQRMQSQNPKQAAKVDAFKLWQDWRAGRALYKSGAAFARHIVDTFDAIESPKTVERWVTQWRKDAEAAK